ncbi:hypothetical protein [Moraxella lacunata]
MATTRCMKKDQTTGIVLIVVQPPLAMVVLFLFKFRITSWGFFQQ